MTDSQGSNDMSGSDSGSYESSSSEEEVLRPVYVSKKQRGKASDGTDKAHGDSNGAEEKRREMTLQKAGHEKIVEPEGDEFGGVDDTDDLDPEKEYRAWRLREAERRQRDRQRMAEKEQAKDDRVRRENLTEQELETEFRRRQKEHTEQGQAAGGPTSKEGVFFHDDEAVSMLLKRDHAQPAGDDDNYKDHSRPTKLKYT